MTVVISSTNDDDVIGGYDMINTVLEKIEADVVIVLDSDTEWCGRVIPFWECDINLEDLYRYATKTALQFVEEIGGGEVTFCIHDFR